MMTSEPGLGGGGWPGCVHWGMTHVPHLIEDGGEGGGVWAVRVAGQGSSSRAESSACSSRSCVNTVYRRRGSFFIDSFIQTEHRIVQSVGTAA